MADYDWDLQAGEIGPGRVTVSYSFTTAGAANPTVIGGLGTTATSLPNFLLLSITYGATGKYSIVHQPRWYFAEVCEPGAEIEDISVSDGAYATIGNFANEGTSTAITYQIATWSAGGAATAYTGRRVFVTIKFLNSKKSIGP